MVGIRRLGLVADASVFDAWGILRSGTGARASSFAYAGYETSDGDVLLLSSRYYQPTIGRFLQEDRLRIGSLYPYVGNAPVALVDPLGFVATG